MEDATRASGDRAHARAVVTPGDYRKVFHAFDQGFCILEVLVDAERRPIDYRFLEVNDAFERLTGLTDPVGRTALELVPDLERSWIDLYGGVALTGEAVRFTQGSEAMGRWFDVHASRIGPPEALCVALLFNDVTALRREQEERRRVEDALRASEHRLRTFADTAPAMLWVTAAEGRCTYLSRGWYEYTGQSAAEGLGFGWLEAVHPDDRVDANRRFADANARRAPFELEHRVRRFDGTYRWVIDAGRPRWDTDGAFAGFVGAVIDIHDRKLAEERLDLAVTAGQVGLWLCDLPFAQLVWNRRVKEHFGLPPDEEVTIDTFYERLHPDDRASTRRAIDEALANRTTFDSRYRTVAPDGRVRWIRAIGRARYDGDRPERFDGITVDVTELVALQERAELANRAKDEFLAMLGHELRNPLAPILTALQLVKLRGIDAVERERAIIERQVRHLVGLVDDLLDVSRIARGTIDLKREPLDVADVVAQAVEVASPLIEQQRHRLDVHVPRGLLVEGDARRLAQVVANLLTNAAKYTEAGGTVTILAEPGGDEVALSVRDTGIGIDEAMLPRIFDLFVQERQTLARSEGGLGLGLAIVRSLTELHGGRVGVSSPGKGQGCTFTIRLPRLRQVSQVSEAAADPAPAGPVEASGRVLIVDDNRDGADLLAHLLRAFGYQTRIAHDGPAALVEAERFVPDVALVDIGLPVMDGYELAARLRHQAAGRGLRLIAVTGYGQPGDREASSRAGFAAHLVKPVDADELRAVLTEVGDAR